MSPKQSGFTLIELLLVIGLLTLSVGVTTDIVLTLVRSYNKTQVTNEIEQNANYVYLKMEKELRTAQSVSIPAAVSNSGPNLVFIDKDGNTIEYRLSGTTIQRRVCLVVGGCGSYDPITNNNATGGVGVQCTSGRCFTKTHQNPDVIQINMTFRQAGNPSGVSFTGSINLTETIVVRGTY